MTLEKSSVMNRSKKFTTKDWIKTYLYGLCMGSSDIVPGISGGTIAFIMGFYQDLISSINSLNSKTLALLFSCRIKDFFDSIDWKFLLALILGVTTAFITLASAFNYLLNHEFYRSYLYAGFLGLILASTCFCAKQLTRWNISYFICLCCGAIVAFFLTGSEMYLRTQDPLFDIPLPHVAIASTNKPIKNFELASHTLKDVPQSTLSAMVAKKIIHNDTIVYNQSQHTYGSLSEYALPYSPPLINVWIICCGAIAISAMLLPGISGSYLLTILGMYSVVLAALVDFISAIKGGQFDGEAFSILANMCVGIILGAVGFSRVVAWLLKNYRNSTIAILTGFMIGALRSVWPFWNYSYTLLPLKLEKGIQLELLNPMMPHLSSPLFLYSCLFTLVGFISVFALEFIALRLSKTE